MHRIITKIKTLDDLKIEATFADGEVVLFDVKTLFEKYPVFHQLEDVNLFNSLKIDGVGYGVSWNDDLDLSSDGIYSRGTHISKTEPMYNIVVGQNVAQLREENNISQRKLSQMSGVMQAEISKIEMGKGNPTLVTLQRLSKALSCPINRLFA